MKLLLSCCVWVMSTAIVSCEPTNDTASAILKDLLANTDNFIRPDIDGPPVAVGCGFYVVSFGSISEVDMDYSMDIYMRYTWRDQRMAFTSRKYQMLTLSGASTEQIWTPDLFFPNEKAANFHVVTLPNKLLKIHANGTVVYSVRLTLKLSCPMDLTHFPMDVQECFFKVESYSYSTSDLTLHWLKDPIDIPAEEDLELPQFFLKDHGVVPCEMSYKSGQYPCLKARFLLEREYGFYMLQTYMPSFLVVILSWVSFWVNMEAVPARISLGVTTVLTIATQMSGSKASSPRVSYPKAIDIWLSTCMFFVFAALVEYALVNALSRKHNKQMRRMKTIKNKNGGDTQLMDVPASNPNAPPPSMLKPREWLRQTERARVLDKTSRVVFPVSFGVFNMVYWIVYLNPH